MSFGGETVLELRAEQEGQERAEDVPADGFVRPVVDRARVEEGLHALEDIFDDPQVLVGERHVGRLLVGVVAQDPETVEPRIVLDLLLVDRHALAGDGDEFALPLVAHQGPSVPASSSSRGGPRSLRDRVRLSPLELR